MDDVKCDEYYTSDSIGDKILLMNEMQADVVEIKLENNTYGAGVLIVIARGGAARSLSEALTFAGKIGRDS